MTTDIYTIGHSNHTWEDFSRLLLDNDIELLVDVRSNPVSRFAPFANHRVLPDLLESVGIDYELMGGTLGGKPGNPGLYDSKGKPDYRKMRSLDEFQDAVEQLAGMASRRLTVVLCSEEDPSQCHRLLLLGPSLEENGCDCCTSGATAASSEPGSYRWARSTASSFRGRWVYRHEDLHYRVHGEDCRGVL